jgi:hypothetical protein
MCANIKDFEVFTTKLQLQFFTISAAIAMFTNPSSIGRNVEIIRLDIMIEIQTMSSLFCVCEFLMIYHFLYVPKIKWQLCR